MKILVTGGAGFIGSHFIRFLQKKEVEIVNLDLLTYAGNRENLMKDIPFVCGDIVVVSRVISRLRRSMRRYRRHERRWTHGSNQG